MSSTWLMKGHFLRRDEEADGRVTTRLADYRRPRWITGFGAPLPRTLGGKIVKREIRSHFPAVPAGAASLR